MNTNKRSVKAARAAVLVVVALTFSSLGVAPARAAPAFMTSDGSEGQPALPFAFYATQGRRVALTPAR